MKMKLPNKDRYVEAWKRGDVTYKGKYVETWSREKMELSQVYSFSIHFWKKV